MALFAEVLAPVCVSNDSPKFLAFIPGAPTKASQLFDVVVSASAIYGGSWLEGSGAVFAENQALRWVSDLAGLPDGAGGCFVSGGSAANLSALVAARETAASRRGGDRPARWRVALGDQAHSSLENTIRIMDAVPLVVPTGDDDRLDGEDLRAALDADADPSSVFAVVGTGGTTNTGQIDDLDGIAAVARERDLWFHVDGAYGLAGLAAPSVRERFRGIEHADSLVVDPHKWLFAPFDCAALVYRDPELARLAHTQHAAYLDAIERRDEWNPSDYAYHLTRRARGLPFWFSLAVHGTDAYTTAVERTLEIAWTQPVASMPLPTSSWCATPSSRSCFGAAPAGARPTTPHGPSSCSSSSGRSSCRRPGTARPSPGPSSSTPSAHPRSSRTSSSRCAEPPLSIARLREGYWAHERSDDTARRRPHEQRSGSPRDRLSARSAGPRAGTMSERNVLGGELEPCGTDPVTGFFRDGCCNTGPEDIGSHTVCAVVSSEFLEHQRRIGNDLSTPMPQYHFPGLVPGDRWCVTARNWLQAHVDGAAAPVVLASTHERALEIIPLEVLQQHAVDVPADPGAISG